MVAASHDRAFLDAVCTDLVDLDPAVDGPVRYGGNYSAYLGEKRAERKRWERRHTEEQEELAELRHTAGVTAHRLAPDRGRRDNEKMGYSHRAGQVQHQISRRVRNATRRLEELERAQVAEPPRHLRFAGAALAAPTEEGTRPLVSLRDVRVPGRLALDALEVSATDRLLVTGDNGAGKSTLLAVLAGQLAAEGEVRRRPHLTVGMLAQDTVFDRPDRTVRDTYELSLGPARAERVPLGSLGLMHADDLTKPVGRLSVGQRRRLALALLVARPPHCCCSTSPPTISRPASAMNWRKRWGPARARSSSRATTAGCADAGRAASSGWSKAHGGGRIRRRRAVPRPDQDAHGTHMGGRVALPPHVPRSAVLRTRKKSAPSSASGYSASLPGVPSNGPQTRLTGRHVIVPNE